MQKPCREFRGGHWQSVRLQLLYFSNMCLQVLIYLLIFSAHMEQESISQRAWYRTILMRGFHALVVLLCTSRVRDTQCGFKLFTRAAARFLFSNLHLERWAFDIELIYLAEVFQIPIAEVG